MTFSTPNIPIAVIGMACRYPGAQNPKELWENILARRRQFRRMPDGRTPLDDYYDPDPEKQDKTYLKTVAVIDGFDFDWTKRRIPRSTYQSTDIVHWLALEVAIAAFEDAGYSKKTIPSLRTGVIVGNTLTGEQTRASSLRLRWPYFRRALHAAIRNSEFDNKTIAKIDNRLEKYFKSVFPTIDEDSLAGGLSNTIAGRICNYLNLDGGGYTVDGACSSSLIAISTAATGLVNKELDLALAGGVDISLDPFEIIGFAKAGALAADDMRVYDRRANGFFPGEGCGFVLLKRLEDAEKDNNDIYAILHGWGISSDGSGAGITAPSANGQSEAIQRAYYRAPFNIDTVDFIEGHGTGTAVGDRVELEAIARTIDNTSTSFRDKGRFCGITSLKSIIGHTKAAAGVGAFLKAVMAVNRRVLPPTAACQHPNPVFVRDAKSIYPISTGKKISTSKILRAGISAMGFGGINCHVCIESANSPNPKLSPTLSEQTLIASNQETELFVLTGQSQKEILIQADNISKMAVDISLAEMADLAYDMATKQSSGNDLRAAIIAKSPQQLMKRLNLLSKNMKEVNLKTGDLFQDPKNKVWVSNQIPTPKIGFVFPGQGSQQLNMAKRLIDRHEWIQDILNQADELLICDGLKPIGPIIYQNLDPDLGVRNNDKWGHHLAHTQYAQPAICLASLIWYQWLKSIGIVPTAVGGHSLGELSAFFAAGVYDAETLIRFAGFRGRVFSDQNKQSGAMISLRCSQNKAENLVSKTKHYATLANINSPRQMVISGEEKAIKEISQLASEKAIPAFRLSVTDAFHSKLVSDVANAMQQKTILPIETSVNSCRLYSSIDGHEVEEGKNLKTYFSDQVLRPVNFIAMIESMSNVCDLFIEVGPGQALSGMINDITNGGDPLCLPVESIPGKDEDMNRLLVDLFVRGANINWDKIYASRLIRPFIPPSEKLFIENPCEKTFELSKYEESTTGLSSLESLVELFSGLGDISREKLDEYLKTRSSFLSRIIQADIEYCLPDTRWVKAAKRSKAKDSIAPVDSHETAGENVFDSTTSIESILFEMVELITGFSKSTLSQDMRLLDDLNLDSIKTGDLLTRVAKLVGIDGEIPPLDFTNMTLGEVAHNINLVISRAYLKNNVTG